MIAPSGAVVEAAGAETVGYPGDGGPAIDAKLYRPAQIAIDAAGRIYIAVE